MKELIEKLGDDFGMLIRLKGFKDRKWIREGWTAYSWEHPKTIKMARSPEEEAAFIKSFTDLNKPVPKETKIYDKNVSMAHGDTPEEALTNLSNIIYAMSNL